MKLPQILVVDDQYARDASERKHFLRHTRVHEKTTKADSHSSNALAEAVFSSGQKRASDNRLLNDFSVVAEAITSAGAETLTLILLDMRFDSGVLNEDGEPRGNPGDDEFGEVLRQKLTTNFPDIPVLVLTSKRHSELAEPDIAYLSKEGLDDIAMATCLLRHGRLDAGQTRALLGLGDDIVAQAPATIAAFKQAWLAGPLELPVLILGETGVGKEVLARYIHARSGRQEFVGLNISAIPPSLFESEMFGAVKGAATGITSDRKGFIERANGGTLFLDEIADMNMDAQAKVLRALEERRAYRLGERNTYAFDVRLLSATSRDLSERIAAGQFREDLYYRIAAETVYMPPLRERKEDIVALAGTMLENVTRASGKTGVTIAPEAGYWLEQYEFPGNVRELRHIVTRIASTVGRNQVVLAREVQLALGGRVRSPQIPPWRAAEHVDNLGAEPRRTGISGPAPVRRELAGALKGASDVYGHAVLKLVERALEETQRVGKDREGDLGSLSPTAAMKLLLDRPDLTTIQAADEMKRIAASAGEPAPASLFEQALGWARKLRGAGAKKRMS